MALFGKTSNPAMRSEIFASASRDTTTTEVMTVNGAINKSLLLLLLILLGGSYTWKVAFDNLNPGAVTPWMIGGAIGGLITALIIIFKPTTARIAAPIYAIFEGLFLGGISAYFEAAYQGIVIQAVALTIGTLLIMLFVYRTGIIKVNKQFMAGIVAATGAVALFYIISMFIGWFGGNTSYITGNSNLSIIISGVIVVIAALNLVVDFHIIDEGAKQGAPKYMEWYGAFALMVTLVWLYLELLKLLAKVSSRR